MELFLKRKSPEHMLFQAGNGSSPLILPGVLRSLKKFVTALLSTVLLRGCRFEESGSTGNSGLSFHDRNKFSLSFFLIST